MANNNGHFGIWNSSAKQWQFGIDEPSKSKAQKALFNKIGKDAYKWRFNVRALPKELWKRKDPVEVQHERL